MFVLKLVSMPTRTSFVSWTLLANAVAAAGCTASTEPAEDVEETATAVAPLNASLPGQGSGIVWHKPNGDVVVWDMASARNYKEIKLGGADRSWLVIGTGDFNADGHGDLFWNRPASFELSLWRLRDTSVQAMTPATAAPRLATQRFFGDLDGDSIMDALWTWFDTAPTPDLYQQTKWLMNSGATTPRSSSTVGYAFDRIVAVGNFDGDSQKRADLLYRAEGSDWTVKVALNGGNLSAPFGTTTNDWVCKGVGDFNKDGKSDVLWHHSARGDLEYFPMDGATLLNGESVFVGNVLPSSGWSIQGVGDLDRNGFSDVIWRHSNGDYSAWMMAASGVIEYSQAINVPPDVRFAGVVELGPPPTPTNARVSRVYRDNFGMGSNIFMDVDFDIPASRPNDYVLVREPPGTLKPGSGPFPMKIAYSQLSAGRARIQLDASKFGARDRASLQLAQWEQGRQSPFSATFAAPGLPQPPPAPSQVMIRRDGQGREFTGCSFDWRQTCLSFSYQDNNPPTTFRGCELWMTVGFGAWQRKDESCGTGSNGGIMTREQTSQYWGSDTRLCFKIRQFNDGGYSAFSNIACTSGATPPSVPATLGLGNGVLMCDANNTNCNYMPRVGQSFRLRWHVCNSGSVNSPSVAVRLDSQSDHPAGNASKEFPISGGVPGGQCVLQQTDPITVNQASSWNWDVYVNGQRAGGTGWNFW